MIYYRCIYLEHLPIERPRSRWADNISGIYLFSESSKPALETSQRTVQWATRTLSFRVKRPGREVDHSPSTRVEVKNERNYTHLPIHAFMEYYRDNYNFIFK
jgi:hypothetical protein